MVFRFALGTGWGSVWLKLLDAGFLGNFFGFWLKLALFSRENLLPKIYFFLLFILFLGCFFWCPDRFSLFGCFAATSTRPGTSDSPPARSACSRSATFHLAFEAPGGSFKPLRRQLQGSVELFVQQIVLGIKPWQKKGTYLQ